MLCLRGAFLIRSFYMFLPLMGSLLVVSSASATTSDIVSEFGHTVLTLTDPAPDFGNFGVPAGTFPRQVALKMYDDALFTTLSDVLWLDNNTFYLASGPDVNIFPSPSPYPVVDILETGTPQDVSAVFGMPPNSLVVQSDVSNVPEPSAAALTSLGIVGLGWARRQLRREA